MAAAGFAAGSVSTGFMQATPGEMKSFRSSEERMALMVRGYGGRERAACFLVLRMVWESNARSIWYEVIAISYKKRKWLFSEMFVAKSYRCSGN